jgi:hypothetical protein
MFTIMKCVGLGLVLSCCQHGWSPRYGLLTLKGSDGQELYFKREVSGPNHDLIIISTNKDYCGRADSNKEYIFDNSSDALYYKLDQDVLSLFRTGPLEIKKDFHPSIRIDYHELTVSEWFDLKEKAATLGLTRLEVQLDDTLANKCNGDH